MPVVAVGDDKIGAISRQLARLEEPELSIIKDIIAGMRPEFFAAQLRTPVLLESLFLCI